MKFLKLIYTIVLPTLQELIELYIAGNWGRCQGSYNPSKSHYWKDILGQESNIYKKREFNYICFVYFCLFEPI